ncbi:MAG: hypothetical protein ACTSR3_06100 [Candidatus Helarchaeota archaeon]
MGLKGIAIGIFVFVGAIVMTFLSVYVIMIDARWHLGQMFQQAATIESIRLIDPTFASFFTFTIQQTLFILIGAYYPEIEHGLFGQSPSSYVLWFVGFIFMFLIIGGAIGLITDKTDLDPIKTAGFGAFVVGGALITTYLAVYLVTADAQWHLGNMMFQSLLLNTLQPGILWQLIGLIAIFNWSFFEHAVGQSASSYVYWFIGFIIVYVVVAAILLWFASRR